MLDLEWLELDNNWLQAEIIINKNTRANQQQNVIIARQIKLSKQFQQFSLLYKYVRKLYRKDGLNFIHQKDRFLIVFYEHSIL